ncbi:type II toxin-antitoxin system RelE/ParE family toxin [Rhizobium sp. B230/85]|uniref:type II toxin-antitoxin system RelE/ParE family toxin n=1 Tax=unclassified Rhizobium TaxID=2613769 RepID=UPI001ADB96EC|nr:MULTISPECIES: type II toxin-antitoxin system RelE/ParE family toxin [unclassified Rhizobium]MBO9133450.1 type II toxin-antitoxin system RelE/ParE family toxin [Rhizobium sp. B209b/85]QXZ97374.1 type II toxin-antitoxin system RelE/ParE family toxin [Rhizobium sp. B230/85]
MDRLIVRYRPQADEDLLDIAAYILDRSQNIETARAYIDRLYARCERIGHAPNAGVLREDLGAGIRMAVFERRVVILYRVEADIVWITNIVSGGCDYETLFTDRRPDPEGPA